MKVLTADDEMCLLKQLQQGDTEAFIQLYNHYHRGLYSYVLHFIKIPELAEDVLQEVFIKIWKIKERINPELSFRAYLYRISRNHVFKLLKKLSEDQDLRLRVVQAFSQYVEDTDNKVRWNQYELLLKTAINQLPMQRQRVFRLCREEGKSYEEVSQELGISRNTVKEHMVMAVKGIKEYFFRYGDISFCILLTSGNLLTRHTPL